jgi:GTP-binding protein LepA
LAIEQNLAIIPCLINKVDLPNSQVDLVKKEVIDLLGCRPEEILLASGKTAKACRNFAGSSGTSTAAAAKS